jgi:hypothetical protein
MIAPVEEAIKEASFFNREFGIGKLPLIMYNMNRGLRAEELFYAMDQKGAARFKIGPSAFFRHRPGFEYSSLSYPTMRRKNA